MFSLNDMLGERLRAHPPRKADYLCVDTFAREVGTFKDPKYGQLRTLRQKQNY
ncbi:hypothetical protein SAMN02799626_02406 [Caulobacter sp. UNC279MFTsu5.1]|nr:hypothetical protein SAMN02799626_02406 [Caulobacter sp. UNC279MFTsu5.1]